MLSAEYLNDFRESLEGYDKAMKEIEQEYYHPALAPLERFGRKVGGVINMGCVTDKTFHRALIEMYPNRRPQSADSYKRQAISRIHRDIKELASESIVHEARRYYEN